MLNRLTFIALTALAAIFLASAFLFLQLNAEEPTVSPPSKPEEDPARFSVSTAVLPGQTSMTLLYITDAKTNKLHIYRAYGDMKTSFIEDPKLYRSFDLTSAGEANLREANQ